MDAGAHPSGHLSAYEGHIDSVRLIVQYLGQVRVLTRLPAIEVWLELNKIGVWWCDWKVLDVVVEGVVGGVGG